jgi:hypothetical protein
MGPRFALPFRTPVRIGIFQLLLTPWAILYSTTGARIKLIEKKVSDSQLPVFNIEVSGAHNYFVTDSANKSQLLVHNQCNWPGWTFFKTRDAASRAAFRQA